MVLTLRGVQTKRVRLGVVLPAKGNGVQVASTGTFGCEVVRIGMRAIANNASVGADKL